MKKPKYTLSSHIDSGKNFLIYNVPLSSHLSIVNGTTLMSILGITYVMVFFKNIIFFVSQDHPQIAFITDIIHEGLNLLQSFVSILSHLRPQKFKHIFQDSLNRLCTCGLHIQKKSMSHFILHCS